MPCALEGAFCREGNAGSRRAKGSGAAFAGRYVLVAAPSGRALAMAARRAGMIPLVADLFGDRDVRAMAGACRVAPGGLEGRFEAETLIPILESLEDDAGEPALGVVYGGGFEDRPEVLHALSLRWPLLGAPPRVVEQVKDARRLAVGLAALGIPHPEISMTRPQVTAGWLMKRQGGGGGGHVREASCDETPGGRLYYQRYVEGRSVSALFLAARPQGSRGGAAGRGRCVVLGFSDQWTAPCQVYPYRYGGAARPATLDPSLLEEMAAAVRAVADSFGLCGLNSADFIVKGRSWSLIEINPRPGATLDIFDCDETPLLGLHLAALGGVLPGVMRPLPGAAAAEVVYVDRDVDGVGGGDWPAWIADRPEPGSRLLKDEPFCTVHAEAASPAQARRLCRARAARALALLHEQQHCPSGRERKRPWRKAS